MIDLKYLIISVAIAAVAIVFGLTIHFLITKLLKRRHSQTPFSVRGIPVNPEYLKGPLRALVPAICLEVVVPFLQFPEGVLPLLNHGLSLWIIGSIAWFSTRVIAMARDAILSRYDIHSRDNLQARRVYTQMRVFERILVVLVLVFAAAAMLMSFSAVRQFGVSILASAGVIGLVIGFAAQRSIATILAGMQIAITQPIRVEDAVVIQGELGWVEEITLTYVVLRLWDQKRLIVPITEFIEKPFQNWTRTSDQLLGTVFIYADYTLPVEKLRAELQRLVENSPLWDGRVCKLQVTNTSANSIELRALASAQGTARTWDLRCYIRERLIEYLQKQFPASLPRARVMLDEESVERGRVEKGKRAAA